MTATQAPTPGPLSAEDVNHECKSCGAFKPDLSAACTFCGLAPTAPVENPDEPCAPENAIDWPTAPVEASGSEREALAKRIDPNAWHDDLFAEPGGRGQKYAQDVALKAADRVLALRPQPSGETRKLLERAAAIADDVERGKRPKLEAVDMIRELRNALLSARPLTLGGQKGESGDTAFKIASDLHAAYEQLIYGLPKYLEAENLTDEENMIREAYITLDVTAHRLAALSTTPARAEAQDEGAAGEPAAWPKTCDGIEQPAFEEWAKSEGFDMAEHPIHYLFTDPETAAARIAWKAGMNHAVERMKAAHPSPTPAADEDRVLSVSDDEISVLLEVLAYAGDEVDNATAANSLFVKAEALAALKSEGK